MKSGRAGTMTHDYKRHGTTTMFAALNVLDGTVIGRNMQRHRHQENRCGAEGVGGVPEADSLALCRHDGRVMGRISRMYVESAAQKSWA
jgi:hypothetical protein